MKISFSCILLFVSVLFMYSCDDKDNTHYKLFDVPSNYDSTRVLPKQPDMLKILAIGNSYTEDATDFLPNILQSAGINNVTLARLTFRACPLSRHIDFYIKDLSVYEYLRSDNNKWIVQEGAGASKSLIRDEHWDVIVLQEYSIYSSVYDFYQPYLNNFINRILEDSYNKDVVIAWHMTWAYSTNSTAINTSDNSQVKMYNGIVDAVNKVKKDGNINFVIPSGKVIQNLRKSSINNPPLDLTRDGSHIDLGAGRYALACTWFETLVAPCFDKSILGNPYRVYQGNVHVTNNNFSIIQEEVINTCKEKVISPI